MNKQIFGRAWILLAVIVAMVLAAMLTRGWYTGSTREEPTAVDPHPSSPAVAKAPGSGRLPSVGAGRSCLLKVTVVAAHEVPAGEVCFAGAQGTIPLGVRSCRTIGANQSESIEVPLSQSSVVWTNFKASVVSPAFVSLMSPQLDGVACGGHVKFMLTQGVETSGVVRDSSGGTVAGALIVSSVGITSSDDNGHFTLSATKDRRFIDISAHAEGYASANTHANIGRKDLDLYLTPESVVIGKVRTLEGQPIEGVLVQVERSTARATRSRFDGSFEIHGLTPGLFQLAGTAPGLRAMSTEPILVGFASVVRGVELIARPAPLLSGDVSLATPEGGLERCAEGWVRLTTDAGDTSEAQTDLEGRVTFYDLVQGRYSVQVGCAGFYPQEQSTMDLGPSDVRSEHWQLAPGNMVALSVVAADGAPAAGVVASAQSSSGELLMSGRSDAEGYLEFFGLPELRVNVTVRDVRHGEGEIVVKAANPPTKAELKLAAIPQGTIVGHVDIQGQSAGSAIQVVARGDRVWWTTPNPEGVFELPVPPGRYAVSAQLGLGLSVSGEAPHSETIWVTAQDGLHTELVTLRLLADEGLITGKVTGEDGSGAVDVLVRVRSREDPYFQRTSLSAADGSFTLERLVGGWRYDVRAENSDGGRASAQNLTVGSTVNLELEAPGRLCGRVVETESRNPVVDFVVTLFGPADVRRFSFSESQGLWCLPELGDVHTVMVEGTQGIALHEQFAGEIVSELSKEGGVGGRVLDAEGVGVSGVILWLREPLTKRRVGGVVTTSDDGKFYFVAPAGRLELHVAPTTEDYTERDLQILAPSVELEIPL